MDNKLSTDLKKKIIDEVSLWIAETYRSNVMEVEDLDLMQDVVEGVVWKHVQELKLRDAMNERVCYLYLVGDTLITIATAFLTHAAEAAGIKTDPYDLPKKQTVSSKDSAVDWSGTTGKPKKQILN